VFPKNRHFTQFVYAFSEQADLEMFEHPGVTQSVRLYAF